MNELILAPILFQAVLAIILLFFWQRVKVQRVITIAGSSINLVIAIALFVNVYNNGIATVQTGNWDAPFGITFVADTLAVTMVLLTALVGLAISIFSAASVAYKRLRFGFFPILHFLLMGLCGSFLTGDIFNLYVWFEIIIISSFVLITLGSEKKQLEGSVKYFTLNMLASIIFLTALGILYGLTGTLNMADLSAKVAAVENRGLVYICALFFFIAFGIKSAVFPLYFWLPDSYHTPPSAVSAIFAGLLTKVAVYALIRVFSLVFIGDIFIDRMLTIMAILTIFSGGLGALVQNNLRKILSYLIVCHIGFMLLGLGLYNEVALVGALFYIIHDIPVKTNLFMVAGIIKRIRGTEDIRALGGLYADYPKLSLLMAIPLFSVIGIPPLSGFWPKVPLLLGAAQAQDYWALAAILFGTIITLIVIVKIWVEVFWKTEPVIDRMPGFKLFEEYRLNQKRMIILPVILLSAVSLYVGFAAEHVQILSQKIASDLIDTAPYIEAVLGKP